jgi:uncharacterized protein (TIGR00369 family)
VDEFFTVDRDGVAGCFGCGPANPAGLRLRFRVLAGGIIETRLQAPKHFEGVEGVLHGGIQSAMLDEVMGVAAERSLSASAARTALVTAELSLRFLRPVLTSEEIVARGRVVATSGADIYVHAEIVDAEGRELTTARSRWRMPRTSVS